MSLITLTVKVYYSVGVAGTYALHIGLHQQQRPLPGSPFRLHVSPGAASASSTGLPSQQLLPIFGVVGEAEHQGCHLVLPTYDRMRNRCVSGGGNVRCTCIDDSVQTSTIDNGDGTYELTWRAEHSGYFEAVIFIANEPIDVRPHRWA